MNRKVLVNIESMAFKGYGVARIGGKVVFIPYSVAGDEAWAEIVEEKRNYSMGRLEKIVKPSSCRVDPRCPYFGQCGGCQWQHIDDSIQIKFKKEILKEVLKRLGGLKEIPPITWVSSSDPYGYRTRIQLKVDKGTIGYHQERSHDIVDIDHCPISDPLINRVILLLRKELPSFFRMKEIQINVSPEEEKGVLILHPLSLQRRWEDFLREFLLAHPILKGLVVVRKGETFFFNHPQLNFTVSLNQAGGERNLTLRASPECFFQVNLKQNQKLIETVLDFSEVKGGERILDLYSGVGNLTLPLAIGAREILGIEENKRAVEDARFNAKENGIGNCQWIHGRVEEVLTRWRWEDFDLVVLDPPRTGCRRVIDSIAALRPKKIVYVSCEPTTFSRDLRLFSGRGYHLQKLCLIDMFPQTYHMEVVGLLEQS